MLKFLFTFVLSLSFFLHAEDKSLPKKEKKIRISSVFFPSDNSRWTDKILSSFHKTLFSSSYDFQMTTVSYDFVKTKKKNFLAELKKTKPDYIFLPDDFLYKSFSEDLQKNTGATILFISLYQERKNLKKNIKQIGVFCDAPVKDLLAQAELSLKKKIDSVLILGGPFAKEMAETLSKKMPNKIKTKVLTTSFWDDYQRKAANQALSGGTVFTLAPFGVKTVSGKSVPEDEFAHFLKNLSTVSFGYGQIDSYPRDFSLGISPEDLGSELGQLMITSLQKKDKSLVKDFSLFKILENKESLKRLKKN